MADNLTVKLGADTSEFRGQIAKAGDAMANDLGHAGNNAGTKFFGAFEHKVLGMKHVTSALATALGLNFEKIGEEVARFLTGVTKEFEESVKEIGRLGDETAAIYQKIFKSRRSDAQELKELELESNRLIKERDSIYADAKKKAEEYSEFVDTINIKEKRHAIELEEVEKNHLRLAQIAKTLAENQFEIDTAAKKVKEEAAKREKEDIDDVIEGLRMEREERKKQGEEDLAWYKKRAAAEKELHDLKLAALPPEEKLLQLQKEQAALAEKIKKDKRDGVDTIDDEIKSLKLAKDVEEATLAIIKEETKEKKEQANLITKSPTYDAGILKIASGFSTYNNAAQQREYEANLIASAKADIQEEIDTIQSQIDAYMRSGSGLGRYEIPALQERIKALRGRQNNVQDYVFNPNYADAAGKGIFANQVSTIGDPLKLQTAQTDILKQVNGGVTELNTRLRMAGFGTGT